MPAKNAACVGAPLALRANHVPGSTEQNGAKVRCSESSALARGKRARHFDKARRAGFAEACANQEDSREFRHPPPGENTTPARDRCSR